MFYRLLTMNKVVSNLTFGHWRRRANAKGIVSPSPSRAAVDAEKSEVQCVSIGWCQEWHMAGKLRTKTP